MSELAKPRGENCGAFVCPVAEGGPKARVGAISLEMALVKRGEGMDDEDVVAD
jgi:hypothetical protein